MGWGPQLARRAKGITVSRQPQHYLSYSFPPEFSYLHSPAIFWSHAIILPITDALTSTSSPKHHLSHSDPHKTALNPACCLCHVLPTSSTPPGPRPEGVAAFPQQALNKSVIWSTVPTWGHLTATTSCSQVAGWKLSGQETICLQALNLGTSQ